MKKQKTTFLILIQICFYIPTWASELPNWLLFAPSGVNHSITIVYNAPHINVLEQARQKAAVEIARNRFCYAIKKKASVQTITEKDENEKSESFELVVANPKNLETIYDSLELKQKINLGSYFIGLFVLKGKSINYKNQDSTKLVEMPLLPLYEKGEAVYSYAKSEEKSLIKATKQATKQARLNIAEYNNKWIGSKNINFQEFSKDNSEQLHKKLFLDESVTILKKLSINRFNISKKKDRYIVFVEIEQKKGEKK